MVGVAVVYQALETFRDRVALLPQPLAQCKVFVYQMVAQQRVYHPCLLMLSLQAVYIILFHLQER